MDINQIFKLILPALMVSGKYRKTRAITETLPHPARCHIVSHEGYHGSSWRRSNGFSEHDGEPDGLVLEPADRASRPVGR